VVTRPVCGATTPLATWPSEHRCQPSVMRGSTPTPPRAYRICGLAGIRGGTGEFTSVDPDLAQTGQPYSYAGDDPVNEGDPSDALEIPLVHWCIGACVHKPGPTMELDPLAPPQWWEPSAVPSSRVHVVNRTRPPGYGLSPLSGTTPGKGFTVLAPEPLVPLPPHFWRLWRRRARRRAFPPLEQAGGRKSARLREKPRARSA
jgi:hypothetical protein